MDESHFMVPSCKLPGALVLVISRSIREVAQKKAEVTCRRKHTLFFLCLSRLTPRTVVSLWMEEEAETSSKTKASDSAYSNSSTSQYQRSDGSSKSRHSNSSGSSGYGGQASVLSSAGNDECFPQPPQSSCTKRKDKKLQQQQQQAQQPPQAAQAPALPQQQQQPQQTTPVPLEILSEEKKSAFAWEDVAEVPEHQLGASSQGGGGEEEENALHLALSQTLHSIKRKKRQQMQEDSAGRGQEEENDLPISVHGGAIDSRVKERLDVYFNRDACSPQGKAAAADGFVVVVSMEDGTVVHTTPSVTATLGFPSDMWLGRDFIDFVHPKDRMSFASHITSGVARGEDSFLKGLPTKTSFYCSLRQYRGLRNVGYGVTRKRVPYLPFRLTFTFREMNLPMEMEMSGAALSPLASPFPSAAHGTEKCIRDPTAEELNRSIFIVITATRIYSAYKVANEEVAHTEVGMVPPVGKFVTRHLASCYLSHIDPLAVPYLGYLPQDMEGRSVMDFYHPEDMPILKEAYMNVMSQPSNPFKGKPYRFRTRNGCYILVETEWSSFVNPWSRKLEFVIGQHHVLKGPSNPEVFADPGEEETRALPIDKEAEAIQKEIVGMLDQKVAPRVSESARQQVSKRCRDLASFMETLMDEMAKPPADPLRVELPTQHDHCFSERDSVMLGEISPHHDYYNGKSSTETPPSYNQLNYNENLQRFFESKPKTTISDGSADMKMEGSVGNNQSPVSTDEEGKSFFPNAIDSSSASGGERKYSSQANESESGGSGEAREGAVDDPGGPKARATAANSKGPPPPQQAGTTVGAPTAAGQQEAKGEERVRKDKGGGVYKGPHLTEALLSRHNEDMEKMMVQKHREQRSLDREGKLKDVSRKGTHEKTQEAQGAHGVKRSGSHSCDGEPHRVKQQHIEAQVPQCSVAGGGAKWAESAAAPMQGPAAPTAYATAPQNNGVRVSVLEGTAPPLTLWPPPLTLASRDATTARLTYSYPGMQAPPKQQSLPHPPQAYVSLHPLQHPTHVVHGQGGQLVYYAMTSSGMLPLHVGEPPQQVFAAPPQHVPLALAGAPLAGYPYLVPMATASDSAPPILSTHSQYSNSGQQQMPTQLYQAVNGSSHGAPLFVPSLSTTYPSVHGSTTFHPPPSPHAPLLQRVRRPLRPQLQPMSTARQQRLSRGNVCVDKASPPLQQQAVFSQCQRPSSQATSVKAEPGSAVGSIASASRLRELLEVSNKCKSIGSSGLSKGANANNEDDECFDRKVLPPASRSNGDFAPRSFNLLQDPETICDDSSYSSLYSFLRTEKSDESMRSSSVVWDGCLRASNDDYTKGTGGKSSWEAGGRGKAGRSSSKPMRKGPSWMEEVDVTPDLILRYKMDDQILRNVLEADLKTLKTISQSNTVNEQLSQLYMDMELEGASNKLSLEDSAGFTSSSGTDDAHPLTASVCMSPSPSIHRVASKTKKKRRSMDYGKLVMIFEENAPFPPPSIST
ncbi:period circadian protein [Ischnura elegans]|uniref:period circadian protein n=1 Tax=Ischnura elegans TaxID=197161 RepID=UPI001ED8B2A5|nr:period circadian protein [Ischnura elegans]